MHSSSQLVATGLYVAVWSSKVAIAMVSTKKYNWIIMMCRLYMIDLCTHYVCDLIRIIIIQNEFF